VTDAVTYVGHATLLAELGGARVLTDPLVRGGLGHIRRRAAPPDPDVLTRLDAILVSHAHHDHLDVVSLRRVTPGCPLVIGPRGTAGYLRRGGAAEVVEVDVGDRVAVGGLTVEAVPALHDGRRYPIGAPLPALGFLLDGPTRLYFAGDTDLFDGMSDLAGRVDLAAVPVGGWGPRTPPGHLDPERAAEAVALIAPRAAIPIHWGTYARIDLKPDLLAPAREFAAAAARVAPDVTVHVLQPGERLELAQRSP
jgi:L-ascorbate metabolism protein UlaG (beta-lactamase superfamily)